MEEKWLQIKGFSGYEISSYGRVRSVKSERILSLSENQWGVVQVGMMKDGNQKHRSVPLLVARAFLPKTRDPFDTPINLDGDRWNNNVENLVWRPRWFAVKYNHQFRVSPAETIDQPIEDVKTGLISEDSLDCAMTYGLLEADLVMSIQSRTFVWPTYQQFRVIQN
jgi:hypothetical protein